MGDDPLEGSSIRRATFLADKSEEPEWKSDLQRFEKNYLQF